MKPTCTELAVHKYNELDKESSSSSFKTSFLKKQLVADDNQHDSTDSSKSNRLRLSFVKAVRSLFNRYISSSNSISNYNSFSTTTNESKESKESQSKSREDLFIKDQSIIDKVLAFNSNESGKDGLLDIPGLNDQLKKQPDRESKGFSLNWFFDSLWQCSKLNEGFLLLLFIYLFIYLFN